MTLPALSSDATTGLPPFITVAFIMYEGTVGVPEDESMASVPRLEIYDLRGRLVTMLVDEVLPAGRHEVEWDGRDDKGRAMSSGVYLSRFEAGGKVAQGRMNLVQ